jgi:hypothetical protein
LQLSNFGHRKHRRVVVAPARTLTVVSCHRAIFLCLP